MRNIYLSGKNVVFDFPYNEVIKDNLKHTFEGRLKFDEFRLLPKKWTMDVHLLALKKDVERLKQFALNNGFQIDSGLLNHLDKSLEKKRRLFLLNDPDISVADHSHGLNGRLRGYQNAAVEYFLQVDSALLGDYMRTGKTVMTLATVHKRRAFPLLIACPKTVKANWFYEIHKWLPYASDLKIKVLEGKNDSIEKNTDIVIVNYDIINAYKEKLIKHKFSCFVMDEAHYLSNLKAARTKACRSIAAKIPYKYGLTGTPLRNNVAEVADILTVLGIVHNFGGKTQMLSDYCVWDNNGFGMVITGTRDLDRLNTIMRGTCYLRRTLQSVQKQMPKMNFITSQVEIDNYSKYLACDNLMSQREILGRGKVSSAVEAIQEFLNETDEKCVVFAYHKSVQKELLKEFPEALSILGEDDYKARMESMSEFQNNPDKRVIVCSIKAASEGINLACANTMFIVEQAWNPTTMEQVINRIVSMDKEKPLTIYSFIANNTIDENVVGLLKTKSDDGELVADGVLSDSYVDSL